jgi:hypothetical protein
LIIQPGTVPIHRTNRRKGLRFLIDTYSGGKVD